MAQISGIPTGSNTNAFGVVPITYFQPSWFTLGTPNLTQRAISPGVIGSGVFHDIIYKLTNGSFVNDVSLSVAYDSLPSNFPITFSNNNGNLTPPIGLNLPWIFQHSGATTLIATTSNQSASVNVIVISGSGANLYTPSGYRPNSMSFNNTSFIDNQLSGKTSGSSQNLFTSYSLSSGNVSGNTFVRNTGVWCGTGLDLTFNATYENKSDTFNQPKFRVNLISPRHYICAWHETLPSGTLVNFVDNNNNVYTRTVINSMSATPNVGDIDDISIGIFDSDLPASITPVSFLPSGYSGYLGLSYYTGTQGNPGPSATGASTSVGNTILNIPVLSINQSLQLTVFELYSIFNTNGYTFFGSSVLSTAQRNLFYKDIITGDSSNPAFFVINGKAVILATAHFAPWSSVFLANYLPQIQAAMDTLWTQVGFAGNNPYNLIQIDLSSFTQY